MSFHCQSSSPASCPANHAGCCRAGRRRDHEFHGAGGDETADGLLYSGLDASVTGEIIDELDKRGTRYEIKGDAILVPQKDRDSVRFALARDGLPKQSVQGYELLDNVNGFSVTSEMYNAAYWRAKEGELTRTILAVPGSSRRGSISAPACGRASPALIRRRQLR
jgi:hypothetical protein